MSNVEHTAEALELAYLIEPDDAHREWYAAQCAARGYHLTRAPLPCSCGEPCPPLAAPSPAVLARLRAAAGAWRAKSTGEGDDAG